jgi:hypothetical protein
VTREQLEAACLTSPRGCARNRQRVHVDGIEDYLFTGCDKLPEGQAAGRLGVSVRTIQRYRRTLRALDGDGSA